MQWISRDRHATSALEQRVGKSVDTVIIKSFDSAPLFGGNVIVVRSNEIRRGEKAIEKYPLTLLKYLFNDFEIHRPHNSIETVLPTK